MRKLGFIVQRYGLEVNGGAELHCRQWAEKLQKYYDIDVLTTQALDYVTWANYYPAGESKLNGITVRRFPIDYERNTEEFNRISEMVIAHNAENQKELELEWMEKQGPTTSALVQYLVDHESEYDAFVFFTYLYNTTFAGMQKVANKSILVPDAHDEWPIYLSIFRDMFKTPRALFYNTIEEKEFVEKLFDNSDIPNNGGRGGAGVDVPEAVDGEAFKKKYGLDDYIIYVGRIDENKGCRELFEYFQKYKKEHGGNTKLVLLGKAFMEIPENEDIIPLGFVSEEDKFNGIAGAKFLILPSKFESLSIVVLEAFSLRKTVLVNGDSEVLKGHCDKSKAGLYFNDYDSFEKGLTRLLEDEQSCVEMAENGFKYVKENYCWDVLVDNFNNLYNMVFNK